ncbi:glycosyltransferase family 2 protein [Pedobacter sp. SD-b]|uniref:Glycosyltransferase family 2 protein n=1 Tax=Pedobacter segetis TaxID=2793069 RepID=A0ABS1BK64_9SPHI|nr:glycosyltransferase family 2 protein [Pedobacter segetis]MBK0383278.1 glycosyltransferase family 2 protein [Pedobacter segetis]
MDQKLTVIIPAYNEGKNIPLVMPHIISFCEQQNYKLIVVNDGSKDDSKELLSVYEKHECFKLISHKINRGYGGALKTGVLNCETEYLITIDADGQHVVENIPVLMAKLIEKDAEMVVGSRKGLKSESLLRDIGKRIIRLIIKRLMPIPIYDINSGMKLYKTDLGKKYCKICPNSMAFSDVICLAFINQFHKVIEEPIEIRSRNDGESTITVKTAFHTVYEIFNIVVLFNPIRIFMPIALVSIIAGVVWGIPILLRDKGVSTGASLSILFGVFTFFFGAMAEQLSQIRKKDL